MARATDTPREGNTGIMTQRREQTIRLAEQLGIEVEPGETTAELMARCIAEVEGRKKTAAKKAASKVRAA